MFSISRHKLAKICIHLLVWLLITLILFIYPASRQKQQILPEEFLIKQIVHIILMFGSYYLNGHYFVPKLFLKNKIGWFVFAIFLLLIFSSFSLNMVDTQLGLSAHLAVVLGKKNWTNPYFDSFGLLTTMFVIGISTTVAIIDKWNKDSRLRDDYLRDKVNSELSFLKAQIQPHFFFNTLNSIYALTYTDVEASRKVLSKLSRMMRYLLYETQQNMVPLEKELDFIKDYIGIMKLRVNKNTTVIDTLPDKYDSMSIAPMLLLPYIENAFKHGIDDIKMVTISITIMVVENGIELKTINNIIGNVGGIYEDSDRKGIGMVNTKRRLDLLYKDNYLLTTQTHTFENEYHLKLTLNLK